MIDENNGQLNTAERQLLVSAIREAKRPPEAIMEIGTWLGGGSTVHILRALQENGNGHLWGVEADRSIYERMLANVQGAAPEATHRFTPIFGFSQDVIPTFLAEKGPEFQLDLVFLDGGDNPGEQITEFQLLASRIRQGGQLLSHDAKLRKGKWLVPYVSALDNWQSQLHDVSEEGLFRAVKIADAPSAQSSAAAARRLIRLRADPIEVLGKLVPSSLRAQVLRWLPARLRLFAGQGRR